MTNRPERLVLVAGTGTEVGKTWVACRLTVLTTTGTRAAFAARRPYSPGLGLWV